MSDVRQVCFQAAESSGLRIAGEPNTIADRPSSERAPRILSMFHTLMGRVLAADITSGGKPISPTAFMRKLRPERYSDTRVRSAYQLEQDVFEYRLDTITSRNQTHDFELFCRKLCERTICPNFRPQTGPEGGGDSKVDSETLPVADEIKTLTYIGEANAEPSQAVRVSP